VCVWGERDLTGWRIHMKLGTMMYIYIYVYVYMYTCVYQCGYVYA
jgi:hypothetical protein